MTVNYDDDFIEHLQEWAAASSTGTSGDIIDIPQNIQDYVDTQWQSMGTFYSDPANLPADVEERGGTFTNPYDMMQHWLSSGLIAIGSDGNLVPSPLIHIVYNESQSGRPYYTVWVGYED